jgi:hypothetical protein
VVRPDNISGDGEGQTAGTTNESGIHSDNYDEGLFYERDNKISYQHQEIDTVGQEHPRGWRLNNNNNRNTYGGTESRGQRMDMDVAMTDQDFRTQDSIISPPPSSAGSPSSYGRISQNMYDRKADSSLCKNVGF